MVQCDSAIQPVECVVGVNEQEAFTVVCIENLPHCVDGGLDAGLLTSTQLLHACSVHDIRPQHVHERLAHRTSRNFANTNGADAGILVKREKAVVENCSQPRGIDILGGHASCTGSKSIT